MRPGGASQAGVATLLTTVILLLCITVLTLYATHVAVTEQRLTANDVRARQALAAAQSGLEAALAALPDTAIDGVTFDPAGRAHLDGPAATLADGARFATRLDTLDRTPYSTGLLRVWSRGLSADGSSRRTVRQTISFVPWMIRRPATPLLVRNGRDPPSREAFFAGVFGRAREAMRDNAAAVGCEPCQGARLDEAGRLLWATGTDEVTLAGGAVGSRGQPVILIVDGDLAVDADTTVTGLLYIAGDLRSGSGRLTVHGALALEGRARHTPEVVRDPGVLARIRRLGRYAKVAGSWNDF